MRQVLVTIERPGGNIETVDLYPKFQSMTPHIFAQIQRDTLAAGRGKVLSYEVIDTDTRTDAEKDYAAVQELVAKAEAAASRGTCNVTTLRLEREAEKAISAWRTQYPTEAQAMDAERRQTERGLPTNDDARIAGERE